MIWRFGGISAIFPAYAGVNLRISEQGLDLINLPRVCGGEPSVEIQDACLPRSSPRMRG